MKNQYFGDKRDHLKFSLLLALAEQIPCVAQLSCVWLLTPPASNNDGNRHFREMSQGTELGTFLSRCVKTGRRDVRQFAHFMTDRPLRYFSYGDDETMYFTQQSRSSYFESIPNEALRRAVVFFDPDNGIEPRSVVSAAHIKLSELRSVFDRMDPESIAVVYQHLPRQRARTFWPNAALRLANALGSVTSFVASGDVGFFIAPGYDAPFGAVVNAIDRFGMAWKSPLMIDGPFYGIGEAAGRHSGPVG